MGRLVRRAAKRKTLYVLKQRNQLKGLDSPFMRFASDRLTKPNTGRLHELRRRGLVSGLGDQGCSTLAVRLDRV
jgi:hypothetical protein